MQFSEIYYSRTGSLFQPLVWILESIPVLTAARGTEIREQAKKVFTLRFGNL